MSSVKQRVAAISIVASASMATVKFAVGIAIGSLALISDALHSVTDLLATIVTWIVVRFSDQPADAEHHYGHGKIESLSALGVIALLYVLAGGIVVEAVSRLREGTSPSAITAVPFIVLLIDMAVNYWRARALHKTARETKSQALAADAVQDDVLGLAHDARDQLGAGRDVVDQPLDLAGRPDAVLPVAGGVDLFAARAGNELANVLELRAFLLHRDDLR